MRPISNQQGPLDTHTEMYILTIYNRDKIPITHYVEWTEAEEAFFGTPIIVSLDRRSIEFIIN